MKEPKQNDKLQSVIKELDSILESLNQAPTQGKTNLKTKASHYLGIGDNKELTRKEQKVLRAKVNKIRTSEKKKTKAEGIELFKKVSFAYNKPKK